MTNEELVFEKNRCQYIFLLVLGIALCVCVFFVSLCNGNYKTSLSDIFRAIAEPEEFSDVYTILTLSRLPRLIASIFVGAALSTAGSVYQELFSNRMASPDILGVSAGASVGASISIYFGLGFVFTSLFAFVGGIAAVILTMATSKIFSVKSQRSVSLILAGIVIGGLMNSITGLFKYLANDSQLSSITFWLLGGFYNTSYSQLIIACPVIFLGITALYLLRWKIVMLRRGDGDATVHGINARIVRYVCIAITTIITSTSICISGTIGWIGLAIPNLIRLLSHNDGKQLLPLSLVYGIFFTELCDFFARSITNTEIPIGILSGILGALMFIGTMLFQAEKSWFK